MISVIVPVYNTEKYLDRCIQSILAQTYTDFELLLIDDGSTDSSGAICDKYAEQDSRVRVFHQVNMGVTAARKKGVNNALGEFVCFIDADDYITNNYIDTFVKELSDDVSILLTAEKKQKIGTSDYIKSLLLNNCACGMPFKLYRKTCLMESNAFTCPREINIGEDLIANIGIAISGNYTIKSIVNKGYVLNDENVESVTRSRSWSLEYETQFIEYLRKILGAQESLYYDAFWVLILRSVKNLILNKVFVPRSHPLYQEVVRNKQNVSLGIGDKLVLYLPFPRITRLCLMFIEGIRR